MGRRRSPHRLVANDGSPSRIGGPDVNRTRNWNFRLAKRLDSSLARRGVLWILGGAMVVLAVTGALSLRAPVPTQAYQECLKAAQEHHPKQAQCKSDESLWERTLSDPVAYYTLWLTLFTAALAITGVAQWTFISREFDATHRPRLRVRNINVKSIGGTSVTVAGGRVHLPGLHDVFSGQFYVANIGTSEARIKDGYLMFFATRVPLPMARPYEGENGNLMVPRGWFPPGASVPVLFDQALTSVDRLGDSFIDENKTAIYALGWIEYENRRGRLWRTAFCREYDTGLWRFRRDREPDPDYESEE